MTATGKAVIVVVAVAALAGVRAAITRFGSPFETAARPAVIDPTLAHLDHRPRHGGLVLMNEDTHFEVVVDGDGACRVYFTDAVRNPLPPAYASQVTVALASGARRDTMPLRLDRAANVWVGRLEPVSDPQAIVRVFYETRGERPYWIDLPLAALRGGPG